MQFCVTGCTHYVRSYVNNMLSIIYTCAFIRTSIYGDEKFCSPGYVAVGACGGSEYADCANGGAQSMLKCCRVVGANGEKLDGGQRFFVVFD